MVHCQHLYWQRMKDYTMVYVRIKMILKELIRALYIIQGNQKFLSKYRWLTQCERLYLMWFGRNVI